MIQHRRKVNYGSRNVPPLEVRDILSKDYFVVDIQKRCETLFFDRSFPIPPSTFQKTTSGRNGKAGFGEILVDSFHDMPVDSFKVSSCAWCWCHLLVSQSTQLFQPCLCKVPWKRRLGLSWPTPCCRKPPRISW